MYGLKRDLIDACGEDPYDDGFSLIWNMWNTNETKLVDGWGPVSLIIKDGEYPDGYAIEDVRMVFKLNNSDTYWEASGRWSSYEGKEWNDQLRQVVPREKTITIYE